MTMTPPGPQHHEGKRDSDFSFFLDPSVLIVLK